MSSDERMRLRGANTLDICATPGRVEECIGIFEKLLLHLHAKGIRVDTRALDGWRNCALIGGTPIPIRIRERLHRVQSANRLSVAIESLLGGIFPERLVPSGKLELQVMRFGVAVASFEVALPLMESALAEIEAGIREAAVREEVHQQRMLASAMAGTATRWARARHAAAIANPPAAGPSPLVGELMKRLDSLIAQYHSVGMEAAGSAGAMSASVANLSNVLGTVASRSPAVGEFGRSRNLARKPARQRCVA